MQGEALSGQWIVFTSYRLVDEADVRRIVGEGAPFQIDAWDLIQQTKTRTRKSRKREDTRLPAFMRFANIHNEEDVVNFAKDYGLLGLFGYRFPQPVWNDYECTKLAGLLDRDNTLHSVEDAAAYLSKTTGQPVDAQKLEEALQGKTLTTIVPRIEPVSRWLSLAKQMFDVLHEPSQKVMELNPMLGIVVPPLNTQSASEGLSGIRVDIHRIGTGLWKQEWRFSSLLDALWLQCAAWLTGNASIEHCAQCGNLFLLRDIRSEYCSDSCKRRAQNTRAAAKKGES